VTTSAYQATREWRSSLPSTAAHAKATETLQQLGGEVLQSENGTVRARFGSRLSLRLWGMLTPKDLPAIMTVTLREDRGELAITANLTSDEGWYLVRLKMLDDKYQKTFADKLTAVQNATTSHSS
jgi:hypothetical protein